MSCPLISALECLQDMNFVTHYTLICGTSLHCESYSTDANAVRHFENITP